MLSRMPAKLLSSPSFWLALRCTSSDFSGACDLHFGKVRFVKLGEASILGLLGVLRTGRLGCARGALPKAFVFSSMAVRNVCACSDS